MRFAVAAFAIFAFGRMTIAADAPGPRVIVDFADSKGLTLNGSQARFERIPLDHGQGLRITTEAAAEYPSVQIEPNAGKWDLTGFDGVEMEVRNPQEVAVRVLLSVNNPGADGHNHCNVAPVSVAPHEKATLTVPFGSWHGETNHPLNLANIVSLEVLLDRPGKTHTFVVGRIRAVHFGESRLPEIAADPFFKTMIARFGRGINLGNAIEAPHEGDWGVKLKESYFEAIASAGFNSVRIPVRWSAHAAQSPPYAIDEKFFDRVDWAVDQALKRKLSVVLNMHDYDGMTDDPARHRERFVALWKQIGEHFKNRPPELVLELLNEPHNKLTSDEWNRDLIEALAAVRASNPTRDVVIGPVGWNAISELGGLKLPDSDRHLIVTVHYYNPFHFTHQGAEFVPGARQWQGTKWTGSKAEQQAIIRDFDTALAWAVDHKRPVYLGEFGSYHKADMESRVRWTRFIADESLKRKMSFAYWEFCSGFGAYDPQQEKWIEPLKNALLDRAN
jgi:endoglucanase